MGRRSCCRVAGSGPTAWSLALAVLQVGPAQVLGWAQGRTESGGVVGSPGRSYSLTCGLECLGWPPGGIRSPIVSGPAAHGPVAKGPTCRPPIPPCLHQACSGSWPRRATSANCPVVRPGRSSSQASPRFFRFLKSAPGVGILRGTYEAVGGCTARRSWRCRYSSGNLGEPTTGSRRQSGQMVLVADWSPRAVSGTQRATDA